MTPFLMHPAAAQARALADARRAYAEMRRAAPPPPLEPVGEHRPSWLRVLFARRRPA